MGYSLIERVEIKGLWGVKNITTEFDKRVNVFIGANGSSKTTFLNMLEATFLCDLYVFSSIEFESIEIKFDSGVTSVVRVDKFYIDDSPFVKYTFNNSLEYELSLIHISLLPMAIFKKPFNMRISYTKSHKRPQRTTINT